jgi:Zn finger protein HypA/HybF involved in hydrogenase expression
MNLKEELSENGLYFSVRCLECDHSFEALAWKRQPEFDACPVCGNKEADLFEAELLEDFNQEVTDD